MHHYDVDRKQSRPPPTPAIATIFGGNEWDKHQAVEIHYVIPTIKKDS
jgi:hypothetical protein